jgi:ZPR1 zinc finger protein
VTLVELDFEIPPITQKGVFTTLEGLLDRAIENLDGSQPLRRATDPAGADAVDAFLERLRAVRSGEALPFTLILDDPSGNSFLENVHAPRPDPALRVRHYVRSVEQSHAMGMYAESAGVGVSGVDDEGNPLSSSSAPAAVAAAAAAAAAAASGAGDAAGGDGGYEGDLAGSTAHTGALAAATAPTAAVDMSGNVPSGFKKGGALITTDTSRGTLTTQRRVRGGAVRSADGVLQSLVFDSSHSDAAKEVMRFPQACFNCSAPGDCRMCMTDVPHFKEVILMAFACDECGWKDVEVKGGGAVPDAGTVTTLTYDPAHPEDLTRDVIKSDTAAVEIPEIELLMEGGSLGGMYTTVEGLLAALLDKLLEGNPFMSESTDSAESAQRGVFDAFTTQLRACSQGARPFSLVLRDPLANSWVYSPHHPAPDPRLAHATYARTHEENLELGLLDMRTEGYGEEPLAEEAEGTEDGGGGGAEGAKLEAAAGGAVAPAPAAAAEHEPPR